MPPDTTSQRFFEKMYAHDSDPWNFSSSPYELNRYSAIIQALGKRRYHHAFEPGCSVGVLTERLADRCDQVYASDLSPTAVATARQRCSRLSNVRVECRPLEQAPVPQGVDLLVLSEIGYYFEPNRWGALTNCLINSVVQHGTILASHWLGHSADHLQHGDDVHAVLHSAGFMSHEYSERNENFRIDRWRKR